MITPILAENHETFKKFIREQNLTLSHFAFVRNADTLRGHSGLILSVGRWWRNEAYNAEFHKNLEGLAFTGRVSVVKGVWSTVVLD